ncbi:MAG: hypothetical protein OHK93_000821 [Ramalina farinacea]|uniref:Uncharacterized protein n=1 Tax=Ramalina farinacea TaxID=258253 RepID=A0AA43QQ23_9LECA|nr:hypothetical protein [Ramalina farinacea]
MSKPSKLAADFDAAVVDQPDTAPPPDSSLPISATTAPPLASSSTKRNPEESAAQFIARMGLFDGQGKNPDILSIIIIANLVAANPDIEELNMSKEEVATLSLSTSFIQQLKKGIKKEDPDRSHEWAKLDSDFIQMLFQYIVLQQDAKGNSYKAWIPICHDVRPSFRTYGKNPSFASTIGEAEKKRDKDKLEVELRWDNEYEFRGYADFMAIWLPIFGTEEERKEEERNVKMYADWQKCLEQMEELSNANLNFERMLFGAQNEEQNA